MDGVIACLGESPRIGHAADLIQKVSPGRAGAGALPGLIKVGWEGSGQPPQ